MPFNINTNKKLVQIYSHPRSGTHFIENFVGRNFYKNVDLSVIPTQWGHWSNKKTNLDGNKFGKLFGSHMVPNVLDKNAPIIYIVRDPRAVAFSIWNTDNFLNEETSKLNFSDFLREDLDWNGTPSNYKGPYFNIATHWVEHVKSFIELSNQYDNLLFITYESLVRNPYEIYLQLKKKFFKRKLLIKPTKLDIVSSPVGLKPNKAKIDTWEEHFTKKDLDYFNSSIPKYLQVKFFS